VRVDAEIDKKVAFDCAAIAFPSNVFPVPGGPNNIIPLGGARIPVNISGQSIGQIIISFIVFFANSRPAISFQVTFGYLSMISPSIISTIFGSKFLYLSSSSQAAGSYSSSIFAFIVEFSYLLLSGLTGGTNFLLPASPG
jgi:hypothetical protein